MTSSPIFSRKILKSSSPFQSSPPFSSSWRSSVGASHIRTPPSRSLQSQNRQRRTKLRPMRNREKQDSPQQLSMEEKGAIEVHAGSVRAASRETRGAARSARILRGTGSEPDANASSNAKAGSSLRGPVLGPEKQAFPPARRHACCLHSQRTSRRLRRSLLRE